MPTIYSDTIEPGSVGAFFRSSATYSVSTTGGSVTISGTFYLQHKGSAYNSSDFIPNYTIRASLDAQDTTWSYPVWGYIVRTDEVTSTSAHSSWTNLKSVSFSHTWQKRTSAYTYKFGCSIGIVAGIPSGTIVQLEIPARTSYTVSYNANGGSGTTASQTKWYDENLELRSNGFTRTNYAFKCWNTSTSDPAASRYAAGETYTGNAALALYAIWNPIISFNANGGSGAPSNQTKTFNSQFPLASLAVPTRTGYTFANWNTAANGSGTSYASNGTIAASMNTATTLYAQWTAKTYTISFATSKGSGVPSSISKTYGQSVTLPTDRPVRIGHTFLGWALSSSAETAQWLPGANFSEAITANTTLNAVWRDDYESPSITSLRAYRCGFELTADTEIIEGKVYYTHSYSYALTEDETVNPNKTYYVYDPQEDEYVEVAEPVDADIATYYERSDVYTSVSEPDVSEISTYYEMVDDDEAGYARVEATWSIDTEVDEDVTNRATVTGTITPEGQQADSIDFQSGDEGTSGTAIATIPNIDVDTQYTITVTVTDVRGASAATSRTVLLLRAFYIFDFGSQGNAVGIGRAAPQSGMEVGYRATFDDEVNLYDELQFNGEQAYPTFKRSSWTPASDETTLPVLPCEVVDEGTSEAFWCDEDGVHRINHAGMTWGQLASRYTWGELAPEGSTPGLTHTYMPVVDVATTAEAEAITDIDRPFLAYVRADGELYRVS